MAEAGEIKHKTISIPRTGGYVKDVEEGDYLVDFEEGSSDFRNVETLGLGEFNFARSVTLSSEHTMVVSFDNKYSITVPPGTVVRQTDTEFKRLNISVRLLTNLYIVASTHPKGAPRANPVTSFAEGLPYVDKRKVGTSYETFNVREELEFNAHSGEVYNRSDTNDLLVKWSADRENYSDEIILGTKDALDLTDEDIATLKVKAEAGSNVPYQILLH